MIHIRDTKRMGSGSLLLAVCFPLFPAFQVIMPLVYALFPAFGVQRVNPKLWLKSLSVVIVGTPCIPSAILIAWYTVHAMQLCLLNLLSNPCVSNPISDFDLA